MKPRYAVAKRRAEEVLKAAKINSPPVRLEAVAKALNAVIKYEPFEGELSGMVHRAVANGAATIGINSLHSLTRQRFTIAHELGHLALHVDESQFHVDEGSLIGLRNPVSGLAVDAREIEANQFAAALLMPEQLIRSQIDLLPNGSDPEGQVVTLARVFKVSPQAMTIRLTRLKLLDEA